MQLNALILLLLVIVSIVAAKDTLKVQKKTGDYEMMDSTQFVSKSKMTPSRKMIEKPRVKGW